MAKTSGRRAQGTGTIYKKTVTRNGHTYTYWEAQVTVGADPGSGKQIRKTFTGKTQKEVREKMQTAAVEVQDGDYFEPSKLTVSDWLDIWLRDYSADWKYLTKQKYESVCRNQIKPALGAVKLAKLTTPQIQSFYNELGRTGKLTVKKGKNGKPVERREPLSSKSIRVIHGVFSKALNTALRVGYIKRNPAELCTIPKLEKKEIAPLTDAQIKDFVKLCAGEDYGRIYKLILFTGLREGEALGLTWDCVDFKSGTLKIKQQLQRQGKDDKLVPLKNSKPRYLTASPFVMQLLEEERTHQLEQRLAAGEMWQAWQRQEDMKTALVFLRNDGSNITAAALYQRYKHLAEMIGAPDSKVHDLRHTFAVLSLQNGDSVKTVQENLGHATAAFTLDVYGHVSEKMKEDSAARMQAYIERMA
jgi:integrase